MRWEYAVLTWIMDDSDNAVYQRCIYSHRDSGPWVAPTLAEALQRLGDEGWELASVTNLPLDKLFSTLYFKRPMD